MPMTAIASARGVVEAGENYCVQKWSAMFSVIHFLSFTAEPFIKQNVSNTFPGRDLGLAHAQDPDLVDTATDLAHAAVATAGIYTTVLNSQ